GLTFELLGALSRHSQLRIERTPPRWLRQARDLLHAHFAENLSPDSIALKVGAHPSHLMREFRRHYGCTIGDYLPKLRGAFASRTLATSDLSLLQIAQDSGFADQSHFSRTFKILTGMTPSTYRKMPPPATERQKTLP